MSRGILHLSVEPSSRHPFSARILRVWSMSYGGAYESTVRTRYLPSRRPWPGPDYDLKGGSTRTISQTGPLSSTTAILSSAYLSTSRRLNMLLDHFRSIQHPSILTDVHLGPDRAHRAFSCDTTAVAPFRWLYDRDDPSQAESEGRESMERRHREWQKERDVRGRFIS